MHVDYLLSFYCFYKRLLSWNVMFFFFFLKVIIQRITKIPLLHSIYLLSYFIHYFLAGGSP